MSTPSLLPADYLVLARTWRNLYDSLRDVGFGRIASLLILCAFIVSPDPGSSDAED